MATLAERWSLTGKTALVTGGTRGIGRAIVEELAGLGASVYTCGRSAETLNQNLDEWKAAGLDVQACVCDVSVPSEREKLIDTVAPFCNGKLNILVNNVGTNIRKPTVEYKPDELSFILSTNFESAYHLVQLAYPLLKASGNGSIVFNSSIAGVVAINSGTLYAATKGAINQITKNLACEWAKDGIHVNSVAPWYISTDLANQVLKNPEFTANVIARTPLKRIGTPQEVAAVVTFLCLSGASYLTGQVVPVDGGMSVNGFYP